MITIITVLFLLLALMALLAAMASKAIAARKASKGISAAGITRGGTIIGMPAVETAGISALTDDANEMSFKVHQLVNLMDPNLNGHIGVDFATLGGERAWRRAAAQAVDAWQL